jgi:hypothetical protein
VEQRSGRQRPLAAWALLAVVYDGFTMQVQVQPQVIGSPSPFDKGPLMYKLASREKASKCCGGGAATLCDPFYYLNMTLPCTQTIEVSLQRGCC